MSDWTGRGGDVRLREPAEIRADQFAVYLMHDDEEHALGAYGQEIIPALR